MRSLSIFAAALFASSAASAADLPVYKKAPPAAVSSWTGFYAGANIGYGWQDPTVTFTPTDGFGAVIVNGLPATNFAPVSSKPSFDIKGAAGGFQLGYNRQVNPNWVLGLETDFSFSDIHGRGGSAFASLPNIVNLPASLTASEQVKWFGTVRARAGYLATPGLLVFASAGLAYGQVESSAALVNDGAQFILFNAGTGLQCSANTACYAGSSSHVAVGWTAGGGLEYAVARNWTVKAEYLYVNLGSYSFGINPVLFVGPSPTPFAVSYTDTHFNLVRIGANYRF